MVQALTALASLAWFLYGVRSGELPQLPGNVLAAIGATRELGLRELATTPVPAPAV